MTADKPYRCAETAVRQALAGPRLGPLPAKLELSINGSEPVPMSVVEINDLGVAAANGYLWTRPTGEAFRRHEG